MLMARRPWLGNLEVKTLAATREFLRISSSKFPVVALAAPVLGRWVRNQHMEADRFDTKQ